jgi:outer membrane immunogenic protein
MLNSKLIASAVIAISAMVGVGSASAADLAARPYTKAPPMMVAMYDWSGFYVGINGGWGQSRDARSDLGVAFGNYNANGGTVGGQVGYRWQMGHWVFGLEAQGNWADISGSSVNLANLAISDRSKMDAFGLFTGQIGYAWNQALFYAKGGAAVTDRRYDFVTAATGVNLASAGYNTNWGPVVGAGIEYGFLPNWSAALEYDHIFQNTYTRTFSTPTGALFSNTARVGGDTDLVTVRVNYRFGGPVIAKY